MSRFILGRPLTQLEIKYLKARNWVSKIVNGKRRWNNTVTNSRNHTDSNMMDLHLNFHFNGNSHQRRVQMRLKVRLAEARI